MKLKKKTAWGAILTFVLMLLLTGCTATLGAANSPAPTSLGQKENPPVGDSAENSEAAATAAGSAIDYTQYMKKTWVRNTDTSFPVGLSFIISN